MHRFTPESQDVFNRAWDLGHFGNEHAEDVYRFMADLECGDEGPYLPLQLQAPTDRRQYHLPPRGLLAVVDWYPPEGDDDEGWSLDLVAVYLDPDAIGAAPWGLP